MRYVRKPVEPGPGEDQVLLTPDDLLMQQYPAMLEYLTLGVWGDGSARERSTLLVLWEEGVWKVCLNDRACGRSLWASGATCNDALEALEARLTDPAADWRKARPRGKK